MLPPRWSSLDLHVLSTPPAFILSTDQTPSEIVNSLGAGGPSGCSRRRTGGPGATEFDHPSRTYRGDGRYRGPTLHRSRLIRYPDAPRNRSKGRKPQGRGWHWLFTHC